MGTLMSLMGRLVLDSSGFQKGLSDAEGKTRDWGSTIKDVISAALPIGALIGITKGITDLALEAQQVPEVTRRFEALNASIDSTASTMMEQMREATQSTVADFDLMSQANRLMSMGLADSGESAAHLAEIAYQLGDPTQDVTTNMENLALMLANQSIPRLDTFGISGAKVRERINELMDSTEGMNRETAFMTAFLEQAGVAMERVGPKSEDLSVKLAQQRAMFDNVKKTIGMAFLPILSALLEAFTPIIQAIVSKLIPAAQWLAKNIKVLVPIFGALIAMAVNALMPVLAAMALSIQASAAAAIAALLPILLPIAAIGAAIAVLYLAWQNNWGGIREVADQALQFIRSIVESVLSAIQAFWQQHGDTITTIANTVWEMIRTIIDTVMGVIEGIITTIMKLIQGDWEGAWTTIKETADLLWQGIQKIIDLALDAIESAITIAVDVLNKIWDAGWEAIKTIVSNAADAIGKLVDRFIQVGKDLISGVIEGIKNKAAGVAKSAVDAARNAIDAVKRWLGIGSPAEATKGIGYSMMEGVSFGIGMAEDLPKKAIQDVLVPALSDMEQLWIETFAMLETTVAVSTGHMVEDFQGSMRLISDEVELTVAPALSDMEQLWIDTYRLLEETVNSTTGTMVEDLRVSMGTMQSDVRIGMSDLAGDFISGFSTAVSAGVHGMQDMIATVDDGMTKVLLSTDSGMQKFAVTVEDKMKVASGATSHEMDLIAKSVGDSMHLIGTLVDDLVVAEDMGAEFEAAKSDVELHTGQIVESVEEMVGQLADSLDMVDVVSPVEDWGDTFIEWREWEQEYWHQFWTAIILLLTNSMETMYVWMDTGLKRMSDRYRAWRIKNTDATEGMVEDLQNLWHWFWEWLILELERKLDIVQHMMQERINYIKIWLTKQFIVFYTIGKAFIESMAAGVSAGAGALIKAIVDAVMAAIAAAKKAAGVASPSKIFYKLGQDELEGWILGIQNKQADVERAMGNVGQRMQMSFGGMAVAPAGTGGDTHIHITANYPYQSEADLMEDIKLLQMLYGTH